MSWQHSPHRRGALLVLSLRQSYLHQNPSRQQSGQLFHFPQQGDARVGSDLPSEAGVGLVNLLSGFNQAV